MINFSQLNAEKLKFSPPEKRDDKRVSKCLFSPKVQTDSVKFCAKDCTIVGSSDRLEQWFAGLREGLVGVLEKKCVEWFNKKLSKTQLHSMFDGHVLEASDDMEVWTKSRTRASVRDLDDEEKARLILSVKQITFNKDKFSVEYQVHHVLVNKEIYPFTEEAPEEEEECVENDAAKLSEFF